MDYLYGLFIEVGFYGDEVDWLLKTNILVC